MFNRYKQSMVYKVTVLLSLGILLIVGFILSIVLLNGVVDVLKQQPSMAFSQEVETHKSIIKDKLMLGLGNISAYSTDIENIYNAKMDEKNQLSEESSIDFLSVSVPVVKSMLSSSKTTGAFIILDNEGDTDEYTAFYLRDPEPDVIVSSQKNFLIQVAPAELAESFDFDKMPVYEPNITLAGIHENILTVPIERKLSYPNNKEIGYWQVSPDFANPDQSIITYSMPLVDQDGNVFGVIGMGITESYLYKNIPESELVSSNIIGYSFGIYDRTKNELTSVLNYNSIVDNDISPIGKPLTFEAFDEQLNLYNVQNVSTEFPVTASMHFLNLYKDTPFPHEEWVFIGYTNQKDLLSSATDFLKSIQIAVLIVLILGFIMSYVVAKKISNPISELAKKIGTNDTDLIHSLVDKTMDYQEIAALTQAIVRYSKNEESASLKTDKIINMVNLPLGTFEYTHNNEYVICSKSLIHMLGIPSEEVNGNKVTAMAFFYKMDEIKSNVEDRSENIFMVQGNTSKWLKIVSAEDENSTLGICLDVSKEVLDKHIREYERDYDRLTKLLNRSAFKHKVELSFQNKIEEYAAFIMFDIDNLKYINDTYGHEMGDFYISSIADVLSLVFRDKCILGRMSGDEFYVFAQSNQSKEEIECLIQSMYHMFDTNYLLLPDGSQFKMRMSGGIAWYGVDTRSLDELMHYADFAMYQGKHSTKGELREFDKSVYLHESFMLNGSEELNRILDEKLIDYVFQVIISAQTGEIYGYEALMRPQSVVIDTPIKLLKIATLQSQLYKIEQITLDKTCAAYIQYADLFDGCNLFINSIPNEILTEHDFMDITKKYTTILNKIILEITEGEKLNMSISDKKIEFARQHGMLVALDDYGSGYCSNLSLLSVKPDIIKMDQMMIKNISTDKNRQSMLQQILVYAKEKNIFILAEGVETFEDMEYLVKKKVDFLQGYYISRATVRPDYDTRRIQEEIKNILKESN